MNKTIITIALATLCACNHKPTSKEVEADKGAALAEEINFGDNAEQKNIEKRLRFTSKPGLLGYIVLLNDMGKPVLYTSVKGKITSSGKRLTRPWQRTYNGNTAEAPSDEGTWGHSSPYIFFWDQGGRYHQWSGQYLYSDQPIRLSEKPLVIHILDGDEPPEDAKVDPENEPKK